MILRSKNRTEQSFATSNFRYLDFYCFAFKGIAGELMGADV